VGHSARMESVKNTVLVEKLHSQRPFGRPRARWKQGRTNVWRQIDMNMFVTVAQCLRVVGIELALRHRRSALNFEVSPGLLKLCSPAWHDKCRMYLEETA
jgi:hypothetical protein